MISLEWDATEEHVSQMAGMLSETQHANLELVRLLQHFRERCETLERKLGEMYEQRGRPERGQGSDGPILSEPGAEAETQEEDIH